MRVRAPCSACSRRRRGWQQRRAPWPVASRQRKSHYRLDTMDVQQTVRFCVSPSGTPACERPLTTDQHSMRRRAARFAVRWFCPERAATPSSWSPWDNHEMEIQPTARRPARRGTSIGTAIMPRCFARLVLITLVVATGPLAHDMAAPAAPNEGIDPGLGSIHHPVTTRNKQAQAYFDQGMRLVFAFNHEAAIKSFTRAGELDSNLAMAQWGVAYALGPNINRPMDPTAHKAAYEALQKAIALKSRASPAERAYIDALSKRYSANADADLARCRLPKGRDAGARMSLSNDNDAAVLYAESLMDLNPSNFWSRDGTPPGGARASSPCMNACSRARPITPAPTTLHWRGRGITPSGKGAARGKPSRYIRAVGRPPGPHAGAFSIGTGNTSRRRMPMSRPQGRANAWRPPTAMRSPSI